MCECPYADQSPAGKGTSSCHIFTLTSVSSHCRHSASIHRTVDCCVRLCLPLATVVVLLLALLAIIASPASHCNLLTRHEHTNLTLPTVSLSFGVLCSLYLHDRLSSLRSVQLASCRTSAAPSSGV
ncbi:unnamed protein product [Protopolystoma xenopodis]|uniref:Uncharacterized protein n=1 Tax=Protopolystoma xenopodis TaxID=117903 RepID=A0A3S5CGC6_9PLAT|nr:unnamed protein product [Protopolystoma xenopodis]